MSPESKAPSQAAPWIRQTKKHSGSDLAWWTPGSKAWSSADSVDQAQSNADTTMRNPTASASRLDEVSSMQNWKQQLDAPFPHRASPIPGFHGFARIGWRCFLLEFSWTYSSRLQAEQLLSVGLVVRWWNLSQRVAAPWIRSASPSITPLASTFDQISFRPQGKLYHRYRLSMVAALCFKSLTR